MKQQRVHRLPIIQVDVYNTVLDTIIISDLETGFNDTIVGIMKEVGYILSRTLIDAQQNAPLKGNVEDLISLLVTKT